MPEARDRLSRPVDVATVFLRRRERLSGILVDESGVTPDLSGSPMRGMPTTLTGLPMGPSPVMQGRSGSIGSRAAGGRGWSMYRSLGRRENTPSGNLRRRRGRGTNSVLPSWYPRTPLRDITAVVRAIERRRLRIGDTGQAMGTPLPSQATSGADESVTQRIVPLGHENSMVTPNPAPKIKQCPPSTAKLHKILRDITNEISGEQEFLTPQKKLLNSIDKVGKVVMEELHKMERTPTAKREEREKRVRTLMSMR